MFVQDQSHRLLAHVFLREACKPLLLVRIGRLCFLLPPSVVIFSEEGRDPYQQDRRQLCQSAKAATAACTWKWKWSCSYLHHWPVWAQAEKESWCSGEEVGTAELCVWLGSATHHADIRLVAVVGRSQVHSGQAVIEAVAQFYCITYCYSLSPWWRNKHQLPLLVCNILSLQERDELYQFCVS